MPNLYTTTSDGVIRTGNESSWSNARDKTSGTVDDTSADASPLIFRTSGRGATTYQIRRFFMTFDTSGITGTVTAATLKLTMSGTSNDPYIEYTVATGYGNAVKGVAAASIGKINGVATANISKVNGI